jgi:signal transduction histidine kinase
MPIHNPLKSTWKTLRIAAIPVVVIGVTVSLGIFFRVRGEQVVEEQLRERMLSTVSIAALQFDAEQVKRVDGPEDEKSAAYRTLVNQLKTIRSLSPQVRFAYIMRRTEDPMTLAFVADADALLSVRELDTNKNGTVDEDEEPGLPGDEYSVEDVAALQYDAFRAPVVDEDITIDQWGNLISAYAPITDDDGEVVAILGMDIKADDYFTVTHNTFSVVAVLLVSLLGALLTAYILTIIHLRNIESLKQLESERSALLDLATHQLGMPLATFKWWLEILKEYDNGKFCKETDVCDQMQVGIDRMDTIIRALHEAGDLEKDALHYKSGKTAVSSATRAVADEIKKVYNIKNQRLTLDIPKNLKSVNIDKKLFHGLLHELLENASSYSAMGTEMNVSAREMRNGVEIKVTDHGYGIPKTDLPRIFEKFRRGSNANKYKPVGNGLGLFIVSQIVDKARGRIRIDSTIKKGTTVSVLLPFAS